MEIRRFHKRNLPHLYYNDGTYFITFRLKDSLPIFFLKKIKDQLVRNKNVFKAYDDMLDNRNDTTKFLSINSVADIVKKIIHDLDGKEYYLICYCVMSNHVHLVFRLLDRNSGISYIMKKLKGRSAIECNRFLARQGCFWQDESFDRLVRDERELFNIINYVINNPVKAGLIDNWKEWKHTFLNKDYA